MTNRNSISIISNNQTMSSLEIAKLTGKRHTHVIRDIREMCESIKDDPDLVHDLNNGVIEIQDKRGYTAEFLLRQHHDIPKSDAIRDYLSTAQLNCIIALQRANTVYIEDGLDFQERKAKLTDLFNRKHKQKLIDEIHLLNA